MASRALACGPGRCTAWAETRENRLVLRRQSRPVVGRKFTIPFTGWVDLHYADDVAKIFIRAAEHGVDAALLYSPRGSVIQVDEYLKTLSKVLPAASELIDARGGPQQVAYDIDDPN